LEPGNSPTALLQYGNLSQPVLFRDCANLVNILMAISTTIPYRLLHSPEAHVPQIIVSLDDYSYVRESFWLTKSVKLKDCVDAVCDLTVDLIHSLAASTPGALCFHCAAVEFGKGLYLFPVTYGAGKSLLATYLCSRGARLYTDDALLITRDENLGVAIGLLPRLRLPLPDQLEQGFRDFVRNRSVLRNSRYCYVRLEGGEMVPYGTSAPVAGIILLERQSVSKPELLIENKKEAIKEVILRNFARNASPAGIVDRIQNIVDNGVCYRLIYQDVPEAANILLETLGKPEK